MQKLRFAEALQFWCLYLFGQPCLYSCTKMLWNTGLTSACKQPTIQNHFLCFLLLLFFFIMHEFLKRSSQCINQSMILSHIYTWVNPNNQEGEKGVKAWQKESVKKHFQKRMLWTHRDSSWSVINYWKMQKRKRKMVARYRCVFLKE